MSIATLLPAIFSTDISISGTIERTHAPIRQLLGTLSANLQPLIDPPLIYLPASRNWTPHHHHHHYYYYSVTEIICRKALLREHRAGWLFNQSPIESNYHPERGPRARARSIRGGRFHFSPRIESCGIARGFPRRIESHLDYRREIHCTCT